MDYHLQHQNIESDETNTDRPRHEEFQTLHQQYGWQARDNSYTIAVQI